MQTAKCKTTLVLLLVVVASCLMPTPFVKAQSNTLTVPDVYPTISAAVGNASDGDTIFVRNGIYNELNLEINKTVRLVGEDKESTVIICNSTSYQVTGRIVFPFSTQSFLVNSTFWRQIFKVTAPNVTLSNFTIKGGNSQQGPLTFTADGTQLINNKICWSISASGNNFQIINNSFTNDVEFSGSNLTVAKNSFAGSISCPGEYNVIVLNNVSNPDRALSMDNNIRGPIYSISTGSRALVVDNRIYAGGLALNGNDSIAVQNSIRSSVLVDGSNNTVCANNVTNGGLIVTGNNNVFTANSVGGYSENNLDRRYDVYGRNFNSYQTAPYAVILLNCFNNTFYQNNFNGTTKLRLWDDVSGPNFWNGTEQGNYWSTFNGTDANGDGVSERPYLLDVRNHQYQPIAKNEIRDYHPLMAPFNGTVYVQLPAWAPPMVTALVHQPPNQPLTETVPPFPTLYIGVATGTLIVVFTAILLFYLKKQRLKKQPAR